MGEYTSTETSALASRQANLIRGQQGREVRRHRTLKAV